MFRLGLRAVQEANRLALCENQIPPKLLYASAADRDNRWAELVASLECGDTIATMDSKSIISRAIARLDGGEWSHVAVHLQDGYLLETTTTGTHRSSIETYNHPSIHVGVYRRCVPLTDPERSRLLNVGLAVQSGTRRMRFNPDRYWYIGAVMAGINSIIDLVCSHYVTRRPAEWYTGLQTPRFTQASCFSWRTYESVTGKEIREAARKEVIACSAAAAMREPSDEALVRDRDSTDAGASAGSR